ncbi:hypothetical protein C1645_825560 [Glomus cerebriforme]|uniref:Uncharacterized protein n=1 Tax=Glomus cerebriforme TaxID=658196 RepID=A0A397SSF5_9GLOM|nr:hypothetical protein C1645_825560 [Glomus cerebriforme]
MGDQLIGHLKEAIKEKIDVPANFKAKDLKISKYFPESPPEEHIHVLVEPPEAIASDEVLKLREEIASLKEKFSKSEYVFDVIVSPKRTNGFKWNVDVRDATLEGLKEYIRKEYNPPSLEKDGAVLKFISGDKERYSPQNDQDFCKMLRQFVLNNNFKLIIVIETPSKAFSDWSFPKVCQLYGLGESDDPSLSVFPSFTCEYKNLEEDSSQAILKHFIAELEARLKSIPISGNEASKSQAQWARPSRFRNRLTPIRKNRWCDRSKDEDFYKGIAQNAVQLESALSNHKRKASEMEEGDVFAGKTFGIITDAEKLRFKLSKPVIVVYGTESMEGNVERVLGHIAWLLGEAQKPDLALDVDKEREIKKVRSKGNLTGKSDK